MGERYCAGCVYCMKHRKLRPCVYWVDGWGYRAGFVCPMKHRKVNPWVYWGEGKGWWTGGAMLALSTACGTGRLDCVY